MRSPLSVAINLSFSLESNYFSCHPFEVTWTPEITEICAFGVNGTLFTAGSVSQSTLRTASHHSQTHARFCKQPLRLSDLEQKRRLVNKELYIDYRVNHERLNV